MIRMEDLMIDMDIDFITSGNHHCRSGWGQVCCPHCGDGGWHLGYNFEDEYFSCYSCGSHSILSSIKELLNIPYHEATQLLEEYDDGRVKKEGSFEEKILFAVNDITVELPAGTGNLKTWHGDYIRGRGYKPSTLKKIWGIRGSGNFGTHKHRIIIPVYHRGRLTSFTSRSILEDVKARYINARPEQERISLKSTVYAPVKVEPTESIAILEGPTGAWRLGQDARSTLGATWTMEQAIILRQTKNRYIMFDPSEPESMKKADELGNVLSAFPGNTEVITLDYADPGEMPQKEADKIKKILKLR